MSSASDEAREALAGPTLHELWERTLVVPQASFFKRAMGDLQSLLEAPNGATILDAGCGLGHHAIQLARNSWHVRAVDFSEAALGGARHNVTRAGVADHVHLSKEDLTKLSFPDESHRYIMCWGVLMHIPNVAEAVRELSRIVSPGGRIVVSELNMQSPESKAMRALSRARGHPGIVVPAGVEHWRKTESGSLLIRHANLEWLSREFAQHGVLLRQRLAGQISELHAVVRRRSRLTAKAVDQLNKRALWSARLARFAISNVLVYEKTAKKGRHHASAADVTRE